MTVSLPEEVTAALKKYQGDADEIIKAFRDKLDARRVSDTIYHYTDDRGLAGILGTGKLWLTDIFNLNDPSELRHGFGKAVEAWRGKECAEAERVAAVLERVNRDPGFREWGHHFTCSFSSDGEELGQWRAYADNGQGYALGFNRKELETGFIENGDSPFGQTFQVTYDDSELTNLQSQIAERTLDLTDFIAEKNLSDHENKAFRVELFTWVTVYSLNAALFFKHKAYRNEQEYRFLEMFPADTKPGGVKVRTRPYSLVRYREFDWRTIASTALREIVVGPAANREKGRQFANDCLRANLVTNVNIVQSQIPYRVA